MDCFGTYFTHVQSCNVTRVQSATAWTASVHTSQMSKAVMLPVFKVLRNGLLRYILHTCPKLYCNPCSKCYGMDCFGTYFAHVQSCNVTGTYFTHVQSCNVTRVRSATSWTACANTFFTHVQSCNVTCVQSATEWTALVHTSHMSKAVM